MGDMAPASLGSHRRTASHSLPTTKFHPTYNPLSRLSSIPTVLLLLPPNCPTPPHADGQVEGITWELFRQVLLDQAEQVWGGVGGGSVCMYWRDSGLVHAHWAPACFMLVGGFCAVAHMHFLVAHRHTSSIFTPLSLSLRPLTHSTPRILNLPPVRVWTTGPSTRVCCCVTCR